MHFVFRFDADARTGHGHMTRSMVLARELVNRGQAVTVLTNHPREVCGAAENEIDEAEIVFAHTVAEGLPDIHQRRPVDWLVVDHYGVDEAWERDARQYVRRVMVIDDLANRRHDCDLLLDQNIANSLQSAYQWLVPARCQQVFGLQHLLARDGFYKKTADGGVGTLVFLGGGDHSATLCRVVSLLDQGATDRPLEVLVTSAYSDMNSVTDTGMDGLRLHVDVSDPVDLYSSVAMAVVRCGFIAYELALLGVPMLIIHQTAVQTEVARALADRGYGVAFSEADLSHPELFASALREVTRLRPIPMNSFLRPGAEVIADLLENFQ